MDNPDRLPDLMNDVRFLRDVVERTEPGPVNYYWSVTLAWGCLITAGYLLCGWLGMTGRVEALPWVWPILIAGVGWPLHWYLARRVRTHTLERGVRPRFRKDLLICWLGIWFAGMIWTAGFIASGAIAGRWRLLLLVWGSLHFVGFIMNGALLAEEWYWAAGLLLVSTVAVVLAGPGFYWLLGLWMGGSMILAGLLGRRGARALA